MRWFSRKLLPVRTHYISITQPLSEMEHAAPHCQPLSIAILRMQRGRRIFGRSDTYSLHWPSSRASSLASSASRTQKAGCEMSLFTMRIWA